MSLTTALQYTNWANSKYMTFITSLDEKTFDEPLPGFTHSLRSLVCHIVEVYQGWLSFISMGKFPEEPDFEAMNRQQLLQMWEEVQERSLKMVDELNLEATRTIKWDKNDKEVSTTTWNMLFNLVTHSAYHRGQMALVLRYLGFEWVEETDFNPYIYELGQQ